LNKKKRERTKAKVMSLIVDLIAFEKEPGVQGFPLGLHVHNAKKELAELAKHL
jgi:hypothetical protein